MFELRGSDARSKRPVEPDIAQACNPAQHLHMVRMMPWSAGCIVIDTNGLAEEMDKVRTIWAPLRCECGAVEGFAPPAVRRRSRVQQRSPLHQEKRMTRPHVNPALTPEEAFLIDQPDSDRKLVAAIERLSQRVLMLEESLARSAVELRRLATRIETASVELKLRS